MSSRVKLNLRQQKALADGSLGEGTGQKLGRKYYAFVVVHI